MSRRKPCNTTNQHKSPAFRRLAPAESSDIDTVSRSKFFQADQDEQPGTDFQSAMAASKRQHREQDEEWRHLLITSHTEHKSAKRANLRYRRQPRPLVDAVQADHPDARGRWRDQLVSELLGRSGAPMAGGAAVWFVTIVHEPWVSPTKAFSFDLAKAQQKVRNAFTAKGGSKLHYLAVFEFELVNSDKEGRGFKRFDQVHPHVHAIVWGDDAAALAHLRRLRDGKRFSRPGGRAVVFKPLPSVANVARVTRYALKSPTKGKRRTLDAHGRYWLKHTTLTRAGVFQLSNILSAYDLTELVFAGGDGTRVRAATKAHFTEEMRERARRTPKRSIRKVTKKEKTQRTKRKPKAT